MNKDEEKENKTSVACRQSNFVFVLCSAACEATREKKMLKAERH